MTNYENIPTITQPRNLKVNLFRHQLASVYQMEKLEREKKVEKNNCVKESVIGINADPTGYGKTISMVALILRDKMEWDNSTTFVTEQLETQAGGRIKISRYKKHPKFFCTLVVTNQSIVSQWEKEFSYTDLSLGVITTKKDVLNVEPDCYDVILVSCTMYNKLMNKYDGYAWKRFIFDEPGHIRIPAMANITAGFYWLVSATPNRITNLHINCKRSFMRDMLEGTSYMGFEYAFADLIVKNDIEFVEQSFSMPETIHNYHQCYDPLYHTVKGLVNDNVSAMISAGNISGAIKTLGGSETSNIIDLIKRKMNEELEEVSSKINIYTIRMDADRIDVWNRRKEKILNQMKELDKRFFDILNTPCGICYGNIVKPVMEPKCQNIMCGECLLNWLKDNNSCPFCRYTIDPKNLIHISNEKLNESENETVEEEPKTKNEMILDIIKNKDDGKFIIFSSHDETFSTIRTFLYTEGISFGEIKGTVHTRDNTISKFKEGQLKVIFLNSGYNASGINLQEATDIILYHEMGIDTQTQIFGRANRIGRTLPLNVHHLLS
jgi:superfamily II DNA or RNA helicase